VKCEHNLSPPPSWDSWVRKLSVEAKIPLKWVWMGNLGVSNNLTGQVLSSSFEKKILEMRHTPM